MNPLATSLRDKLIIVALILFGLAAFIAIWADKSLAPAMGGIIGTIITGLCAFYKGDKPPVPPPATSNPAVEGQ